MIGLPGVDTHSASASLSCDGIVADAPYDVVRRAALCSCLSYHAAFSTLTLVAFPRRCPLPFEQDPRRIWIPFPSSPPLPTFPCLHGCYPSPRPVHKDTLSLSLAMCPHLSCTQGTGCRDSHRTQPRARTKPPPPAPPTPLAPPAPPPRPCRPPSETVRPPERRTTPASSP